MKTGGKLTYHDSESKKITVSVCYWHVVNSADKNEFLCLTRSESPISLTKSQSVSFKFTGPDSHYTLIGKGFIHTIQTFVFHHDSYSLMVGFIEESETK